jgi:hypothetical protein
MALLKAIHKGWQVDLGYAFNQNTDAFNTVGTAYTPANTLQYMSNTKGVLVPIPSGTIPNGVSLNSPPSTNGLNQAYKSFTSLYINKKIKQTKIAALVFNDHFGKYKVDTLVGTAATGYLYGKDYRGQASTHSRLTYGLMLNQVIADKPFGKIGLQAAYYNQTGSDKDGNILQAYHYTLSTSYIKSKWNVTIGYDVLSGNDGISTLSNTISVDGKNRKFDPLYGTPHRHWGYMDYFYVGTNSPVGGLNNGYVKMKYIGSKTSVGIDIHDFRLNKATKKSESILLSKKLGNEIDFTLNHSLNKFTQIELGYSLMKATSSMPYAKGQATNDADASAYNTNGQWFYIMINVMPKT